MPQTGDYVDDDDDIDSDLPGPSLLPFKLSHFLRQNNVLVIVQDAAINGDVDEEDNGDDDDDDDSINQPGELPLLLQPQEPKQDPL